ncbi:NADPH-dependent 2,4-dienoyl-CoA reductase/sulfur reductase-like enzyme [Novosphingobium sp. SG751A]|uniref:NAD(P)/FAD-dependent oxidoreductase n=1 Tax=Novosphingobium sp. SG751A TaxID=2587000 RepID=UPI0015576170|nr:FAD/NAD(P)-binding oxidoreductase [Novosphingobium sp. SG751A]NOW44953.1 NADPH-dependent 2,4-dienoyl-CoA reductase/sulfur reductase-like enzyme [Novosphingobium sp. SG751A]
MTAILVVGAGPAGMSAAIELSNLGFAVTVVDDQSLPGGRIFAGIETREIKTHEERSGADLVAHFRRTGGTYLCKTEAWQIQGTKAFVTCDGHANLIDADFIVLATGAQERPMPFTGWQLPGVMTIGAAQILLKTARQIPDKPVWLAGSGPLLLLYAHQLKKAGGKVAGVLDTSRPGCVAAAARHLPGALPYGWRDLLQGARWLAEMRPSHIVRNVASIVARGEGRLSDVHFQTRSGATGQIAAELLLVHDGVVPSTHNTMAAGCGHRWNPTQRCFEPIVDQFCQSTIASVFVAGDGASIAGGRAAMMSGRLAAIGIARASGRLSEREATTSARPLQAGLVAAMRFRRFVDTLYPTVEMTLPDEALVCRCEEVLAGTVRAALAGRAQLGTDAVKIATRAGMGPCQGRQCGLSLARLVAEVHGQPLEAVRPMRIRPPLKPLTLQELATLLETTP